MTFLTMNEQAISEIPRIEMPSRADQRTPTHLMIRALAKAMAETIAVDNDPTKESVDAGDTSSRIKATWMTPQL